MDDGDLRIDYAVHDGVQELIDRVIYALEAISLDFDRWDEQYVSGPGLYLAVVTGPSVASFADPMGRNEWPTDRCRNARLDLDAFVATARDVAMSRGGAVVVGVDGVVEERMVRFRDPTPSERADLAPQETDYEDWMGARHMSALDTSRRPNVVTTLTLSEETGRVSRFRRGAMTTFERNELGGAWNPTDR